MNNLKELYEGKVRTVYEIDEDRLLIICSDRLSCYDTIICEVKGKGSLLNQYSMFWADKLDSINYHLLLGTIDEIIELYNIDSIKDRCMLVRRLNPLPFEIIVRKYLYGSSVKEYQENGEVSGNKLPEGLIAGSELEYPIITPSTKARRGSHDISISNYELEQEIGSSIYRQIIDLSLYIYDRAYKLAYSRGLILADTKLEFGLDSNNKLYVIDELLTPDSSRIWDKQKYDAGEIYPYDKQYIRDHLIKDLNWSQQCELPSISKDNKKELILRYQTAFSILNTQIL